MEHLLAHIEVGQDRRIALVPTIESARGLRKAARIAAASFRIDDHTGTELGMTIWSMNASTRTSASG